MLLLISVPPKKRAQQASGQDHPVSEAIDRLYGAPLEQFIALRRELANALRAAGELPASRLVATAAKPTRTAWALNQVARHHSERLRAFFDARDAAATAQARGDAQEIRSTLMQYRERLADVVWAARSVLAQVGMDLGATQSRRIGESLQATSSADDAVRAQLLAGRLAQDIEAENPFAGLDVGPPRGDSRPHVPHQNDGTTRKRDAAERAARERELYRERAKRERAIEQRRERVAIRDRKAREARAAAAKANAAAARAQSAVERATRAVVEAEHELEKARGELQRLTR